MSDSNITPLPNKLTSETVVNEEDEVGELQERKITINPTDKTTETAQSILSQENIESDKPIQATHLNLDFIKEDSGEDFHNAIQSAKTFNVEEEIKGKIYLTIESKIYGAFVDAYPAKEYDENEKKYLLENGLAGFVVKNNGDIASVFKHAKCGIPGLTSKMIPMAVDLGGNHLDCYNTVLPKIYSEFGFVPVAKVEFNTDYAPDDWNYARDDQPDIIFMIYDKTFKEQYSTENISSKNEIEEKNKKRINKINEMIYKLEYSKNYKEGVMTQMSKIES
ncbi:MAG: hypothetical protein K940chlam9_01408 [Chlamydiae bacterium]|nr:hypothetical protein [Chlamydiota bacterium]